MEGEVAGPEGRGAVVVRDTELGLHVHGYGKRRIFGYLKSLLG